MEMERFVVLNLLCSTFKLSTAGRDKSIRVESTDIVTCQYREQLVQVLASPDWANRKEPRKKVSAKLLLLGDSYKALIEEKKQPFLGMKTSGTWQLRREGPHSAPTHKLEP
ncbi:hypothetical protein NFI96_029704, partial [Prochilodus magdalenae]